MPMSLGSNWIFRVTEAGTVPQYLSAIRRPLFVMGLAPVVLLSAGVFFSDLALETGRGHILILALFGTIVAYLCLRGFQKIPFTCSFLPGNPRFTWRLWRRMGTLLFLGKAAQIESAALDHPSNRGDDRRKSGSRGIRDSMVCDTDGGCGSSVRRMGIAGGADTGTDPTVMSLGESPGHPPLPLKVAARWKRPPRAATIGSGQL